MLIDNIFTFLYIMIHYYMLLLYTVLYLMLRLYRNLIFRYIIFFIDITLQNANRRLISY